tara:strand:+ start:928 stop:1905 length:978 start_codon:yes stop_codon:yes gene_type:complete
MTERILKENLFSDVVGQINATTLLDAVLRKKRVAPSYLFVGPEGVGRKLTALRFLEGLINNGSPNIKIRKRLENRNFPDLLWLEPTYTHQGNLITKSTAINEKISRRSLPQIRLEQIKEMKRFLGKQPVEFSSGLIVIEDLETITEAAANALLKTLEEPNHGIFILISEKPELILNTIISRCQKITFHRLSIDLIKNIFNERINFTTDISIAIQQKELLNLSNGSPGAIIKNIELWENIPKELWPRLKEIPNNNPIEALSLAKELTEKLDSEQQVWLIGWLQQHIWMKETNIKVLKKLEKLRFHIQSLVNPRLAWETTLLQLNET